MKLPIITVLAGLLLASCSSDKKETTMHAITHDSTSVKTGYSQVNGIKMYYELHGDNGEYLVLIHGGGSTITTSFATVLPLLAKDHKVVAVELQNHGHTESREVPETFEQDADDVAALLANLHIEKASFFGFSNGGNTAIQIALRHPNVVNKLVLASTFYKREGFSPGFFDGMKQLTVEVIPKALKDAFLKINNDSTKLLATFNKDRERMLHFKDWSDADMASIAMPTLIINGDHDVVSNEHAVAMSRLIKNSRLMILPGAHGEYIGVAENPDPTGHLPQFTAQVVTDFLTKH